MIKKNSGRLRVGSRKETAMSDEVGTKHVGIEIPVDLWRRMKRETIDRDTTLKIIMLEALEIIYGGESKSQKAEK
jgi:hypothetical protein